MKAQQIRNSILQMAVHGNLVPQDPNDEPAFVLVDSIRKQQKKLIQDKIIKKERYNHEIDYKEPLPEGWCYVKLGELTSIVTKQTGFDYSNNIKPNLSAVKLDGMIPMVQTKNFKGESFSLDTDYYIPVSVAKKFPKILLDSKCLLLSIVGASIGNVGIYDLDNLAMIGGAICKVKLIDEALYEYLYYYFLSPLGQNEIKKNLKATAQGTITVQDVREIVVEMPPLSEQHRIVERLKEVLPLIDKYDVLESRLESVDLQFPQLLKKSIFQQAVMGKLVPQDPNDEPASVLLENIRAEKDALVKAGKLKKDKHESIIYRRDNSHYEKCGTNEVCIDDELAFEVPKSWEVIRLNDIGIYRKGPFGSSLTKAMFIPKGPDTVKVYEQKNAIRKDHTLGDYYISRKYYAERMSSFSVKPGDIIVSCAGTIGETYVLPDGIEEGIINQALMRMSIFASINIDYFLLYFDYVLKQSARADSKGSAIKNIPPFEIFKKLLLPLPPIQEQKRIVDQVNTLSDIIEKL